MRRLGLTLLLASIGAGSAHAQRVNLVGFVRDTAGRPVPNASVLVVPDQRARADSAGRFVVTSVKTGMQEVRVRRIGYKPYLATLHVHDDGRDTVRVELETSPVRLPALVTRAERKCAAHTYDGLVCRKADGRGKVYSVEDLDEAQPEFLADLFRDQKGFRIDFGLQGPLQTRFPRAVGRCLQLLVNGRQPIRGFYTWSREWPEDIVGLELYLHDEVPQEYKFEAWRGAERCALVNVWTWHKLKK